jgi:ribonuclease inhibitor
MAMELHLDGRTIRSEAAFHDVIEKATQSVGFEGYGRNLDALSDVLTGILPRPLRIRWLQASVSRKALGPRFDKIAGILHEAQRDLGPSEMQLIMEN